MPRYNTSLATNSISGSATISSPYSGAFTALTGTAPYTVTLPSPVLYPGSNQTFYNATSGTITLSTPSGVFSGLGSSGTSSQTIPTNTVVSVTSDGTNYVVLSEDGSVLYATDATITGNLTANGSGSTISISPQNLTLSPTGSGSMNNVSIGGTTRASGSFTSLTANQQTTLTANITASNTASGTLVVTGGAGISGTLYAGALNGPLTGTIQTAAQPNITSTGGLTIPSLILDASPTTRLKVGDNSTSVTTQNDYSNPLIIERTANSGKGAILFRGSDTIGTAIEQGRTNSSSHWGTYLAFLVHDNNTSDALLSVKEKVRVDADGLTVGNVSGNLGVGIAPNSSIKLYSYSTGQYSARIEWNRNSGPSSWAGENTLQLKNTFGGGAVPTIGFSVTDTDGDHHRAAIVARSTGGATGALEFYTREGGGGTETSSKIRIISSGRTGIGIALTSPEGRLHVREPAITAANPSIAWPNFINPDGDTNAKPVAIFDTDGNGNVATAGQGGYPIIRIGSYYDSRGVITMIGAGGASPSDQGSGRGKDLMIKAGTSDNTNGYLGGRLYLNGGAGYSGGTFGATGFYGDVRIQGNGGNTWVGRADTYGAGYNNLYLPFTYNGTGEWAPHKGTGWIHLGSYTHRAGNRYLDIKTNNNSGSLMFMFWIYGYLYNSANINTYIGGYSYTGNSILNLYTQNLANCTATAYRTSTNNFLCLKIDRNSNGYSEGKVNVFFHAWSQGEMDAMVVTSYAQNDSASNYYTS